MGDKFSVWKKHFEDMARGLIPHEKDFYKVSSSSKNEMQTGEEGKGNVTLISPPQQIVERAKSQLKKPRVIYDPVTGIVHQSKARPQRVRKSRKRRKVVKRNSRKRVLKKQVKKKLNQSVEIRRKRFVNQNGNKYVF